MRIALGNGNLDMHLPRVPPAAGRSESARFQLYEYAYYLIVFYSITNSTFGIEIPYFGTLSLLGLSALCLLRTRKGMFPLLKDAQWPLLCVATFVVIEKLIHNEATTNLIPNIAWAANLIVIQSICFRPGFLTRFSFAIFGIGMTVIPFMTFHGTSARIGLSAQSAISNPNNLSAWFGFCAVYFLIRALQATRPLDQAISGVITFSSLIIVGLTVSRGALVAIALAVTVIFRKQLRRGFIPLFALVLAIAGGLVFGVFDSAISHYTERGAEETGRGNVLVPVVLRIAGSPFYGVGMSNTATKSTDGEVRYPHDSLLFFGLASGVVPLLLLVAYTVSAFRVGFHMPESHPYSPYVLPLLVYCSFFLVIHDSIFMYPWYVASFAICQLERRRRRRFNSSRQNTSGYPYVQGFAPRRL